MSSEQRNRRPDRHETFQRKLQIHASALQHESAVREYNVEIGRSRSKSRNTKKINGNTCEHNRGKTFQLLRFTTRLQCALHTFNLFQIPLSLYLEFLRTRRLLLFNSLAVLILHIINMIEPRSSNIVAYRKIEKWTTNISFISFRLFLLLLSFLVHELAFSRSQLSTTSHGRQVLCYSFFVLIACAPRVRDSANKEIAHCAHIRW